RARVGLAGVGLRRRPETLVGRGRARRGAEDVAVLLTLGELGAEERGRRELLQICIAEGGLPRRRVVAEEDLRGVERAQEADRGGGRRPPAGRTTRGIPLAARRTRSPVDTMKPPQTRSPRPRKPRRSMHPSLAEGAEPVSRGATRGGAVTSGVTVRMSLDARS